MRQTYWKESLVSCHAHGVFHFHVYTNVADCFDFYVPHIIIL